MSTFKPLGILVTPVALEMDDAGNVIAQHTLPAEFVFFPVGLNAERVMREKLAELQSSKEDKDESGH
jgi:hypothetical protein